MFALLDRVSEVVMLIMSFVMLTVCLWGWFKENEYASLGYLVPAVYFCIMYTYVVFFQAHNDAAQQMFGRTGLFIFMVDVTIWRAVFIRRRQKQRYGEY